MRRLSKFLTVILVAVFLFCSVPAVKTNADSLLATIKDESLRNYLKSTYGVSDTLSSQDIAKIKRLDLAGTGVTRLDGIQILTSLEYIDISSNAGIKGMYSSGPNGIHYLDLSYFPNIETVKLSNDSGWSLNVSNCEKLRYVYNNNGLNFNPTNFNTCGYISALAYAVQTNNPNAHTESVGSTGIRWWYTDPNTNQILMELYIGGYRNIGTGRTTNLPAVNGLTSSTPNPTTAPRATNTPVPTTAPRPTTGNTNPTAAPQPTTGNTNSTTAPRPTSGSTNPTTVPSNPGNTEQPVTTGGAEGFVRRLYDLVLGRSAEQAEVDFWMENLYNGSADGASVAKGFLTAQEFLDKGLTNEQFLDILYAVFFDRASEPNGVNFWIGAMNSGFTKLDVIDGFVNSTEWANVCLTYGIVSGGTGVPDIHIDANEAVVAFATRFYTTCLAREGEADGISYWADCLANMQVTGSEAAAVFFFGPEFVGQNNSDSVFVARLYETFMGRSGSADEINIWVDLLSNGTSRNTVFEGFAISPEFANLCHQAGIRP